MAQGHIRIVLLPIIYNIMVGREEFWQTPFFTALESAMQSSTYMPLLQQKKKSLISLTTTETIVDRSEAKHALSQMT